MMTQKNIITNVFKNKNPQGEASEWLDTMKLKMSNSNKQSLKKPISLAKQKAEMQ